MSRLAFGFAFLALVLQTQAQTFSQGPPASVTSPTADGRTHGMPASVLSPKVPPFLPGHGPFFRSEHPLRSFGTPRRHHVFVPVPVFYAIYDPGYASAYPSAADPYVPDPAAAQSADSDLGTAASEDALRQAYLQGVRDSMAQKQGDPRYGQHYLDSRESARSQPPAASSSKPPNQPGPSAKPQVDDSPATVFVFKDGHQIETRNFAIMGQTIYDFSSSGLKKLQISDLDAAATMRANDDRGITVKLP